jgi:hypothetical protein
MSATPTKIQKPHTPKKMKILKVISALIAVLVLASCNRREVEVEREQVGPSPKPVNVLVKDITPTSAELVDEEQDEGPPPRMMAAPRSDEGPSFGPPNNRPKRASVKDGNRAPVLKTVARGQSVRVKRWTDENGCPQQEAFIVQNGTPMPKNGRVIQSEPGDAFVNGPNGEPVNIPAGAEVPDSVMQAIFRKQGRVKR